MISNLASSIFYFLSLSCLYKPIMNVLKDDGNKQMWWLAANALVAQLCFYIWRNSIRTLGCYYSMDVSRSRHN